MSDQVNNNEEESLPPVKLTDLDKERYWRHITEPSVDYKDTIELVGGKLKLNFRAMVGDEYFDIGKQIDYDKAQGLDADPNTLYRYRIDLYRLAIVLESVNGIPLFPTVNKLTVNEDPDKGLTYLATRADLLLKLSMTKLNKYRTGLFLFDAKIDQLAKACEDPDFYKADV